MSRPRLRLFRIRHASVIPMEVWDREVDGNAAFRRIGRDAAKAIALDGREPGPELARRVIRLAAGIHAVRLPNVSRGFGRLRCHGGLTVLKGFEATLLAEPAPFRASVAPGGPFSALAGAPPLLAMRGGPWRGVPVVDVGQTGIKIGLSSCPGSAAYLPRDETTLPVVLVTDAPGLSASASARLRSRFEHYLAGAIERAASLDPGCPPWLVLALPCEIGDDGALGGCTYAGVDGPVDVVCRACERAVGALSKRHAWWSADSLEVMMLNDAELAAFEHVGDRRGPSPRAQTSQQSALFLTLGFGPGAAMLM